MTYRLEERDVVVGALYVEPSTQAEEVGLDAAFAQRAALDGLQDVAGFGECPDHRVDEDSRSTDRHVVGFAHRRCERTDEVEVAAGVQRVARDHWR